MTEKAVNDALTVGGFSTACGPIFAHHAHFRGVAPLFWGPRAYAFYHKIQSENVISIIYSAEKKKKKHFFRPESKSIVDKVLYECIIVYTKTER